MHSFLLDSGFHAVKVEPVSTRAEKEVENKYSNLFSHIIKLAELNIDSIKKNNYIDFSNFFYILKRIHSRNKAYHPCNAGLYNYTLTVDGGIYCCQRMINNDGFYWGDIDGGCSIDKRFEFLSMHYVDKRKICRDCWARYLCGGDCYATSYFTNKDSLSIDLLHCSFNKEIIKNALFIYSSLSKEERSRYFNKASLP